MKQNVNFKRIEIDRFRLCASQLMPLRGRERRLSSCELGFILTFLKRPHTIVQIGTTETRHMGLSWIRLSFGMAFPVLVCNFAYHKCKNDSKLVCLNEG